MGASSSSSNTFNGRTHLQGRYNTQAVSSLLLLLPLIEKASVAVPSYL